MGLGPLVREIVQALLLQPLPPGLSVGRMPICDRDRQFFRYAVTVVN